MFQRSSSRAIHDEPSSSHLIEEQEGPVLATTISSTTKAVGAPVMGLAPTMDSVRVSPSRFFLRRYGSQPSLTHNGNGGGGGGVSGLFARGLGGGGGSKAKKRASAKSSSQQSLSTATSLTVASPNANPPYVAVAAAALGPAAPATPSSQRSPLKKKVSRRAANAAAADDHYSSTDRLDSDVPRVIMGPPIVAVGGLPSVKQAPRIAHELHGPPHPPSHASRSISASNSGVSTSLSSGRNSNNAKPASRLNIYVPHLDDTVSSFDDRPRGSPPTAPASTAATPAAVMDYCRHVREAAGRRLLPPHAAAPATPPARTHAPNLLPSDEGWLRHEDSVRRSRCEDEDTDINDDEYGDYDRYDDDYGDDDDARSGSMCDTLHNSLGNDDSYRMRVPPPASPARSESVVSCAQDSLLHNGSSVGTGNDDSFKLPGPYSVCDESLHNSSSYGASRSGSSSRERFFDRAIDEDGDDLEDASGDKIDQNDEWDDEAATGHRVVTPAPVLEEGKDEERQPIGGIVEEAADDDDEQSLSPEEAVEVVHTHGAIRTAPQIASRRNHAVDTTGSARSVGPRANDRESGSSIIEIFPGCKVPLRGCRETWGSFREGTAVLVPCAGCLNCVYCVPDATMVLCPHCRDISPLATTSENQNSEASVGLGMSVHESKSLLYS